MNRNASLLYEIETYLTECGIAESTFGFRAVNDGKFVKRLRLRAKTFRETEERVRNYIRENPPTFPQADRKRSVPFLIQEKRA